MKNQFPAIPCILITVLLLFSFSAYSTDTPVLHCVSVNPNGSITLTWEPVTTAAGFSYYNIVSGLSTIVGTINNITASTYTDNTAAGNSSSSVYQVVAVYNFITMNYSNQMFSMYLNTTNNATTNPGIAMLNWNSLPFQYSSTSNYNIYQAYNGAGNMSLVGNTINNVYSENITDCNVAIQYQIRVSDALCESQSNIAAGTFSSLGNSVGNPDLHCTSVLPNGNVKIEWTLPSGPSTDFHLYEIYRDNALIDSVNSFSQDSFVDVGVNANIFNHSYYMITKSGCSGEAVSTSSNIISSIYLAVASPAANSCQQTWTPLPLLPSSGFYQVNRDISGSVVLISNTTSLNYTDVNVPGPATAYYQITVIDNAGCISHSNISTGCVVTDISAADEEKCKLQNLLHYNSQSLEINAACLNASAITIEFYNTMGQLVTTENLHRNSSEGFSFHRNNNLKGMMLYVIKTEEHIYSGKTVFF